MPRPLRKPCILPVGTLYAHGTELKRTPGGHLHAVAVGCILYMWVDPGRTMNGLDRDRYMALTGDPMAPQVPRPHPDWAKYGDIHLWDPFADPPSE